LQARSEVTNAPTSDKVALPPHRLQQIEDAAAVLLDTVVPPNTRRAFAQDWALWRTFCASEDVHPHTVSPGLLVAFVTWLAHPQPNRPAQAPATIDCRLTGVLDGWRQAKLTIPHGITRDARKIVRAYERNLARENIPVGRGSAPALTIRDLRRIVEACPPTLEGIRDRTIIVIGFGIAARRSELATLLAATSHETPAVASSPSGTAKPAVGNPSSHPAPKPKPAR
jgi:integrase